MSDTALNRILSFGTDADRIAFVPDPPTPAAGAALAYIWFTSDTLALYAYDFGANAWVEITGGGGGVFSGAMVVLSADEAAANNTEVDIPWDTEVYDEGGYFAGGDPTKFTAPEDGKYHVSLNIRWESSNTGVRQVFIEKNGTDLMGSSLISPVSGQVTDQNIGMDVELDTGEYVKAVVYQTSGGSLNVLNNAATRMAIHKIK